MNEKKKNFGWGYLVFGFVILVGSLTMSAKVEFKEATATGTLVCAAWAIAAFLLEKFNSNEN